MKKWYATFNPYGSPTSVGFKNTLEIRVFASKAARDKFVSENQDFNLSVCKIKTCQIERKTLDELKRFC